MPRRSGRWIALAAIVVIGGLIALIITGQGTLSNDSRQVNDRWKPLRATLTDRYTQLANAAGSVDQVSPDRTVSNDINKAGRTWAVALKRSDVDAQVAAANDLEGLARRLEANVAASPKLSADPDVRAAIDAFRATVPETPLVDAFDDATAKYARDRTSIGRRLAAAMFGYEPRPALRLA